jgi:RNA polymerase sigma-70 factor (ECF subfamily)
MSTINQDQKSEFDYLFRKYFPRLRAFARVIVKEDEAAKDIVQEAFIKSWEEKDHIEWKTFESYLFRMVRNRCLNHIRDKNLAQQKKQDLTELNRFEEIYRIDFVRNEPYLIFEKELKDKLNQAIDQLPPRCKEVFVKSRMEGMKNREIAEELDINIKNVERHISSALKTLKKHFATNGSMLVIIELLTDLY